MEEPHTVAQGKRALGADPVGDIDFGQNPGGALGENEMAEGLARLAVSGSMSARSQELAAAGVELTAAGLAEAAAAEGMRDAAKDWTAQAVGEVAAGAAALGASDTLEVMAEDLEQEEDD